MLSHVKRLINWARTDAYLPLGIERPTVIREIETHYVIGGNGVINGAWNGVYAYAYCCRSLTATAGLSVSQLRILSKC